MLEIVKKRITLTKGDDASIWLKPKYKDKTDYVAQEGDKAYFRVKTTSDVLEIECNVNVDANKIVVSFTPNDTKDMIPGIYRYEAELVTSWNMHYTFLADQTFILGKELEKHTSNANSHGINGNNIPSVDGELEDEPIIDGDIQPTNPSLDYETLNHLPKINHNTLRGDMSNEDLGIPTALADMTDDEEHRVVTDEQISDWNNKVEDDNYVHTDNNYDDTAKNAVDALGTASTYDVPESGNASTSQVVKGDDTRLTDNRNPNPHTHSKADITDFPTNVSAFNNDSGFITNTVNNLANYYLKSETYTRAEVEQLIAAIKQGKFEIVAELPASGDANVIYLVPKSTAQTSNSYDEYVYINNAWEKIGDTDIDLSGYVTDDELTTALQSYLTTSAFNTAIASYYTKTETDNLLANKVDKVAGKGLSTNDYDNTAKGIVDGVTSALNDKVDKVQGKGLSTNDYDNTAKGIVDGVTSALADKVDKVNGKGLSTEDYTTTEKSKLGDISNNAKKVASSSTNGHIEIDDVDTTVYDDTAIKNALSTETTTIEGNPLAFTTLTAQTAESTIIDLEPIQDLHGYDKPWVGGAGKNKLPMTVDRIKALNTSGTWNNNEYTFANIVYTLVLDNDNNVVGIKTSGTTTSSGTSNLILGSIINANSLILNGCPNGGATATYKLRVGTTGGSFIGEDIGSGYTFTANEERVIAINFGNSTSGNGLTFYPMVRLSTESDVTFVPYTNECSISGRSEIRILGRGESIIPNETDTSKGYISGAYLKSDGTTGGTISNFVSEYFDIKGGVAYVLYDVTHSANAASVCFYDENKAFISGVAIERTTKYINAPQNAKYARCTQFINIAEDEIVFAYGSNNLTISLGQTVYGGQIDVEKGECVVDKKILVIDGTNISFGYKGGNTNVDQYYIQNLSDASHFGLTSSWVSVELGKQNGCICNQGDFVLGSSANSGYSIYVGTTDVQPRFSFPLSMGLDTLVKANTYAQSNPIEFIYPLATPITIQLSPNAVNLLKGANYITTDGDKITLTYRTGEVATLGDLKEQIAESQILIDTATGTKYKLVVTNGVLDIEEITE